MSLCDGEFYRTLIESTESQFSEVQYNCAGIIGHIAIDSMFQHATYVYTCSYIHVHMKSDHNISFLHIRVCFRSPF